MVEIAAGTREWSSSSHPAFDRCPHEHAEGWLCRSGWRQARARFLARIDRRGPDECWPWTAGTISVGYGSFRVSDVHFLAHRVSYELLNGTIPDGLEIDHLCRNRLCCNPTHMEAVTAAENKHREQAAIKACPQGHEYTPENTYRRANGDRRCRTCTLAANSARQAQRRSVR